MATVQEVDDYLSSPNRLGGNDDLWSSFKSHRRLWWEKLTPGWGRQSSPLWYFVEHGWHHAEMLYASLSRWVQVLETNLESPGALLANPAEWFTLACAAYLHDSGMSIPTTLLADFREAIEEGNEGKGSDLVSDSAREFVSGAEGQTLLDGEIRDLHPDLGAWWIGRPDNRLIPNPEDAARAVAQVVRLHGKSCAEERLDIPDMNVELGGTSFSVRVGMLAAIIAVADSCLVGRDWVRSGDDVAQQERARQQLIGELEDNKRERDGQLGPDEEDQLELLGKQAEHILRHRVVRTCVPTPESILVVPREFGPDWGACTSTLDGDTSYRHAELVKLVVDDIREELVGAGPALEKALGVNALPQDVYVPRSAEEYESLTAAFERKDVSADEATSSNLEDAVDSQPQRARVLRRTPLDKCETSKIFPGAVEKLLRAVGDGEPLITIEGAGGMGKSWVAAALFDEGLADGIEARWFIARGEVDPDAVFRSVAEAINEEQGDPVVVVFDERRHGLGLGPHFFEALLKSSAMTAMWQEDWQVVLAIRPDTAKAIEACLGHDCTTMRLGMPESSEDTAVLLKELAQAALGRPPKPEQLAWLTELAVRSDTGLLSLVPFVIDKVLVSFLRDHPEDYREKCDLGGLSDQELIYRRLIVSEDDPLAQITMEAMAKAGEFTSRLPGWLITATIRCMGEDWVDVDPRVVEDKLHQLTETSLIVEGEPEPWRSAERTWEELPERRSWGFVHDLIPEAIRQETKTTRVALRSIRASAKRLVSDLASRSIEDYEEALWMWSALCVEKMHGHEPIVMTLAHVARALVQADDISAEQIGWATARGLHWTMREVYQSRDFDGSVFLNAQRELAQVVAESVTGEQVLRDIHADPTKGESCKLLGVGHQIMASRRNMGDVLPMVDEIAQAGESALSEIARRFLDARGRHPSEHLTSFYARLRASQLMAWAGRWIDAGDLHLAALARETSGASMESSLPLFRLEFSVAMYLRANDHERAVQAYACGLSWLDDRDGEADVLRRSLRLRMEALSGCDQSPIDMDDLVGRYRRLLLASDNPRVFVLASYALHGSAGRIVHGLEGEGIAGCIMHTTGLPGLTSLHPALGYVLIGAPTTPGVRDLIAATDLTPEAYEVARQELMLKHRFTTDALSVNGVPVTWIGGMHPWDEAGAVRKWLEDDGPKRLAARIANASPSSPRLPSQHEDQGRADDGAGERTQQ